MVGAAAARGRRLATTPRAATAEPRETVSLRGHAAAADAALSVPSRVGNRCYLFFGASRPAALIANEIRQARRGNGRSPDGLLLSRHDSVGGAATFATR